MPGSAPTAWRKRCGAPNRIGAILAGRTSISGDTALRLGRYFGTGPAFWMNVQGHYDIEAAERRAGATIEREVTPRAG